MDTTFIEASYPLDFREENSRTLGQHLRERHSVELVGMKRVGISNFLRFFLYNKEVIAKFINHGEKHLFIPVDLNDLVERELFPFWTLSFKRLVDRMENYPLDEKVRRKISRLFLDSIQTKDIFLTLDGIRQSLLELVGLGVIPTFFFIRFDRLKEVVTEEFFNNLQGLRDGTAQKLSFVFTSFRTLNDLVPSVFKKESLTVFCKDMYVKPAGHKDMEIILDTFKKRYGLEEDGEIFSEIIKLAGGHVQYLQLALILFKEGGVTGKEKIDALKEKILKDERISLQSEELWESLSETEKEVLLKVFDKKILTDSDKQNAKYLWDTGFILEKDKKDKIFSPIFENYLTGKSNSLKSNSDIDFSKKESVLFNFLKNKIGVVCEREEIIETVWPEYEDLGVSDWAIDKLVARVRAKLHLAKMNFRIVTVRTRGYKLVNK